MAPIEEGAMDHALRNMGRTLVVVARALVAERVRKAGLSPVDGSFDGLGVRVQKEFRRIAPNARIWRPGAVDPISVPLPGSDWQCAHPCQPGGGSSHPPYVSGSTLTHTPPHRPQSRWGVPLGRSARRSERADSGPSVRFLRATCGRRALRGWLVYYHRTPGPAGGLSGGGCQSPAGPWTHGRPAGRLVEGGAGRLRDPGPQPIPATGHCAARWAPSGQDTGGDRCGP